MRLDWTSSYAKNPKTDQSHYYTHENRTEPPKNTKTKSENKHANLLCDVMYTLTDETSNNKPPQKQRTTTTTTTTTTMHPKHRPRCSPCALSNRRFGGRRGFCLLLILLLLLSLMHRWRLHGRIRIRSRSSNRSRIRIRNRTRHMRKQDRTSYDAQQAF